MPIILDGRDLAARVGVRYEQVLEWARDGQIPCIRCERRVMFNLGRVLDAMAQMSQGEGDGETRSSELAIACGGGRM
jgi:predicted site-specific integrase-resolvase